MIEIVPIGLVQSVLKKEEDCPLQEHEGAPEAIIELFEGYATAAEHIKPGAEIILLTWLDKANRRVLKTKPRNDPNGVLTGVFSTRSPDRPNPIGIHYTRVISIQTRKIKVSALEVIDQTPVIDIKPQIF